jgi:hypothetical protein
MPNVYLIRQDHTHLFGDALESAVVIAESVMAARKSLRTVLHKSLDTIIWDEGLWAITRLGNNAKYPPDPIGPVVCKTICSKYDLPPGNYGVV